MGGCGDVLEAAGGFHDGEVDAVGQFDPFGERRWVSLDVP